MSEVGSLSAALRLDGATEFQREMQNVGQQFREAGNQGRSFGQLGAQAFKTAAGASVGLTTAAGAYLTVLAKTGIEYNSLQQNSRAALSVMLGGAEKANVQMDKLDAFARNSPFSKSVFIDAQQQLLGFGVEASKVMPTLDAIQNTVASFGGNAEQISSITDVMARLQSQGRLSGDALERLGYYGVDAAKIIGEQMGLTAAEIKDMASKPGGIPVEQIWDPLVTGMTENFGGATDKIKQQWSGAVDRITAANRDIGAVIAEPFVAKNGGGMAVTWGNQVADVLRAIESQAKPVMEILTARGGGLFVGITEGLDTAQASIERFNPQKIDTALDALSNHTPAIGALSGVLLALGTSVGPLGAVFSTMGLTINPVVAAFVGLAAASPEVRAGLAEVAEAGAPLLGVIGDLAQILSGTLTTAMPIVADGLGLIAAVAGPLVDIVAQIPAPVLLGVAAFLALHKATGPLSGGLGKAAEALKRFGENSQLQAALGDTSLGIGAISTASMGAKSGVEKLGGALKTAFLANPIGVALTVVSAAVGLWAAANANAEADVQAHNDRVTALMGTLNETSGATTEATRAQVEKNLAETRSAKLADEMGISQRDVTDAILGNEDALKRVNAAMDEHIATTTTGDANLDTWSATATNAKNRVSQLSEVLDEQISAQQAAAEAVRAKVAADREAAAAMSEAARSNKMFNDALQVANDATQDAETRLRALKQALDEISGGTKSARQAQTDLAETSLNLRDALAATGPAGEALWQSFINGAGAIDNSTREGIAFERMLDGANDKMLQAMQAANDEAMAHNDREGAVRNATAAGKEHVTAMQEELAAAGLGAEAIAALTAEYFAVPELVATTMQLDGVTEVGQQVLEILGQLALVEEGKTITIANEGGEETVQILRDLGYEVTSDDGNKTITITAEGAETVTEQLETIAGTQVPEKIFKVDAETAEALAKVDGVNTTKINDKWSYVYGENADAIGKIEAVKKNNPNAKVVPITAEDSGFWGAWGRIAGAAMSKIIGIGGGGGDSKFAGGFVAQKNYAQGGFGDTTTRSFAQGGGYDSGVYTGVQGGLWHMGLDGVPTNFAEGHLGVPWEVYISGKSGNKAANVGYALEALRRLGAPSIPIAALGGTPGGRQFYSGGSVGVSAPAVNAQQVYTPTGTGGPMVGTVVLGQGVTRDEFVEFERRLDFFKRGGS